MRDSKEGHERVSFDPSRHLSPQSSAVQGVVRNIFGLITSRCMSEECGQRRNEKCPWWIFAKSGTAITSEVYAFHLYQQRLPVQVNS